MSRLIAPMVVDGPINGDLSEPELVQVLLHELQGADVVIMDKLSHRKATLQKIGECNVSGPWDMISSVVDICERAECVNFLT